MSHISLNYMLKLVLKSKYICTRMYRYFLELFFLGKIFLNLASLPNTPLTSLSKKKVTHSIKKKNCSMFLKISLLICKKKCVGHVFFLGNIKRPCYTSKNLIRQFII